MADLKVGTRNRNENVGMGSLTGRKDVTGMSSPVKKLKVEGHSAEVDTTVFTDELVLEEVTEYWRYCVWSGKWNNPWSYPQGLTQARLGGKMNGDKVVGIGKWLWRTARKAAADQARAEWQIVESGNDAVRKEYARQLAELRKKVASTLDVNSADRGVVNTTAYAMYQKGWICYGWYRNIVRVSERTEGQDLKDLRGKISNANGCLRPDKVDALKVWVRCLAADGDVELNPGPFEGPAVSSTELAIAVTAAGSRTLIFTATESGVYGLDMLVNWYTTAAENCMLLMCYEPVSVTLAVPPAWGGQVDVSSRNVLFSWNTRAGGAFGPFEMTPQIDDAVAMNVGDKLVVLERGSVGVGRWAATINVYPPAARLVGVEMNPGPMKEMIREFIRATDADEVPNLAVFNHYRLSRTDWNNVVAYLKADVKYHKACEAARKMARASAPARNKPLTEGEREERKRARFAAKAAAKEAGSNRDGAKENAPTEDEIEAVRQEARQAVRGASVRCGVVVAVLAGYRDGFDTFSDEQKSSKHALLAKYLREHITREEAGMETLSIGGDSLYTVLDLPILNVLGEKGWEAVQQAMRNGTMHALNGNGSLVESVMGSEEFEPTAAKAAFEQALMQLVDIYGDVGRVIAILSIACGNHSCERARLKSAQREAVRYVKTQPWTAWTTAPQHRVAEVAVTEPVVGEAKVLEAEAAAHNSEMHALNGNTTLSDKLLQAVKEEEVTQPPPASEMPTGAAGTGVLSQALKSWTECLVGKKSSMYVATSTADQTVRNWAQVQKVQNSLYNNTGFQTSCSFPSNALGSVLSSEDDGGGGTRLVEVPIYSLIDPSGSSDTKYMLSKAGQALHTAAQSGELVLASQIIRINTTTTSGDAMLRGVVVDANKVIAGKVGSASSMLAKILLALMSEAPLLGPETATGNTVFQLTSPLTRAMAGNYFPLNAAAGAGVPVVNARVCNYSDLTSRTFGSRTNFAVGFSVSDWGDSCALVPVTNDMLNRADLLAAWTLAFLEYPWRTPTFAGTVDSEALDDPKVATPPPLSARTRVRGPIANVLYVLVNNNVTNSVTNNVQFTVGTVGVNSNVNSVFGGASVAIGAGLNSIFATSSASVAAWMSALQMWQIVFGNEEDWRSAIVAVSDAAFWLPPPVGVDQANPVVGAVANNMLVNLVNATAPAWNTTGYTETTAANVADLATGTTRALNVVSYALADVQTPSRIVCQLGTYDPVIGVDKAAGLLEAVHPLPGDYVPNTLGGVVDMLRKANRVACVAFDIIMQMTGRPMNQLFGAAGAAGATGATNILMKAWFAGYDLLNRALFAMGAECVTYRGAALSGYAPAWWAGGTYWPEDTDIGWGRVAQHVREYAGVEAHRPRSADLGPLGETQPVIGFPAANDPFSILKTAAPEPENMPEDWVKYAMSVVLGNATRFMQTVALAASTGSLVRRLAFGTQVPTIARGVNYALAAFGALAPGNLASLDTPTATNVPTISAYIANDVFFCWLSAMFGLYDKTRVKQYRMLIMEDGAKMSDTILMSASQTAAAAAADERMASCFRL